MKLLLENLTLESIDNFLEVCLRLEFYDVIDSAIKVL